MSAIVIINPKTGLGEVENKHPGFSNGYSSNWKEGDKTHNERFPPLPVITAAGETLRDGRYECEKVWQFNDKEIGFTFMAIPPDNRYSLKNLRQVWKVIETPELPGGETTLDQHIAEMHTLMEWEETVKKLIPKPSGNMSNRTNFYTETGHKIFVIEFYDNDEDERENITYKIANIDWQKQNYNSIDRDKVIEVIQKIINKILPEGEDECLDMSDVNKIELLTNLIEKIKQL